MHYKLTYYVSILLQSIWIQNWRSTFLCSQNNWKVKLFFKAKRPSLFSLNLLKIYAMVQKWNFLIYWAIVDDIAFILLGLWLSYSKIWCWSEYRGKYRIFWATNRMRVKYFIPVSAAHNISIVTLVFRQMF